MMTLWVTQEYWMAGISEFTDFKMGDAPFKVE